MYHIIAQHVARHVAHHVGKAIAKQAVKKAVQNAPDAFQVLIGAASLTSGADAASNLYDKLFHQKKKGSRP